LEASWATPDAEGRKRRQRQQAAARQRRTKRHCNPATRLPPGRHHSYPSLLRPSRLLFCSRRLCRACEPHSRASQAPCRQSPVTRSWPFGGAHATAPARQLSVPWQAAGSGKTRALQLIALRLSPAPPTVTSAAPAWRGSGGEPLPPRGVNSVARRGWRAATLLPAWLPHTVWRHSAPLANATRSMKERRWKWTIPLLWYKRDIGDAQRTTFSAQPERQAMGVTCRAAQTASGGTAR